MAAMLSRIDLFGSKWLLVDNISEYFRNDMDGSDDLVATGLRSWTRRFYEFLIC